jgi:hypothetical protein
MEKVVFHAGKLNGIENIPMIMYGGVARLPLVRALGSSQLAITSQSATQHLRPRLVGGTARQGIDLFKGLLRASAAEALLA